MSSGTLSLVGLLLPALIGCASSSLQIYEEAYHARRESLVDTSDQLAGPGDSDRALMPAPRAEIVNHMLCSSLRDSFPRCSTTVYLDTQAVFLNQTISITRTFRSVDRFSSDYDKALLGFFNENMPEVKSIELKKYDKTDRGWAFFEGMMFSPFFVGLPALGELLISNRTGKTYNPTHVFVPGLALTAGFVLYRYVKIDPKPRLHIRKISIQ